jgi:hypothetical protein
VESSVSSTLISHLHRCPYRHDGGSTVELAVDTA